MHAGAARALRPTPVGDVRRHRLALAESSRAGRWIGHAAPSAKRGVQMDGQRNMDHSEPVEAQSSPSSILEELYLRHGAGESTPDERSSERHTWSVPLLIEVQASTKGLSAGRKLEVRTIDISTSGFAFDYRQYLAVGTRVRVRFESLPNQPRLVGVVRNCRLIHGGRHRVGVQFAQPTPLVAKKHGHATRVDPT